MHDCIMTATIYTCTVRTSYKLSCAKRKHSQRERVWHALTTRAVLRLNMFDRSYARKRKTNVCGVAQLRTLGGRYLDSLHVVVQIIVVEVLSQPPALRNDKTGLQHYIGHGCLFLYGCLFSYGYLFSYGCLYTGSPCTQVKWVLIFMGAYFVWVPIIPSLRYVVK